MRVREVMYRDLTSIAPGTDLREAVGVMAAHRTSGLPVVDDDFRVVGFLSERDIIETAYPYTDLRSEDLMITARLTDLVRELGRIKGRTAESCMSRPPMTADEDADVEDITSKMLLGRLKVMPVVRNNRLVGVVRRADLAASIVSEDRLD